MDSQIKASSIDNLLELLTIVSELRDPINGCPWDLEQNHASLIPYLLEEAHEVADAIRYGDDSDLKEELGDLLLQVLLHSQIANEEKRFSFADVAKEISVKLIRRHPHVFGEQKLKNSKEVSQVWEEIKSQENPEKSLTKQLRKKIRCQPALSSAMYISRKAAKSGFEWESIEQVWDKVIEEINELKKEIFEQNISKARNEFGDVLFTLINIARWLDIDPEEALEGTNKKFLARFSYVENRLEGNLSGQSMQQLQKLWKESKETLDPNNQSKR